MIAEPMFLDCPSGRKLMTYLTRPKGEYLANMILFDAMPHEINRTQWFYRQLAKHLAKVGIATFRFEYSGVGDSSGDFSEMPLTAWREDLSCVRNYLNGSLAKNKPTFALGTRIGAFFAQEFAEELGAERTVLPIAVDPPSSGEELYQQLCELQQQFITGKPHHAPFAPATMVPQIFGYQWSETFIEELREVKASWSDVFQIHTQSSQSVDGKASHNDDKFAWTDPDSLGLLAFPNKTVALIVDYVKGQC